MSTVPQLPEFPCIGLLTTTDTDVSSAAPDDAIDFIDLDDIEAAEHDVMEMRFVNPPPSPRGVDSLVAEELTKLTLGERQKMEEDVHGIVHHITENSTLLEECLAQLEMILEERKAGTAYEIAQAMDRSYTSARDLREMFVRVDSYDANESAGRIIRFFELKKDLFGVSNLVKDITLKDLNEDDMDALMSGGIQVCSDKDNGGRPIVAMMLGLRRYKSIVNMQRAGFYVYMTVAKTIEAQLYGVVSVTYAVGLDSFETLQGRLRYGLPIRLACQHLAYDDPFCYEKAALVIRKLSRLHMVRFRSHKGTHAEVQHALSAFGIPPSTLPVDASGTLRTDQHHVWLERCVQVEELSSLMPMLADMPTFPELPDLSDLVVPQLCFDHGIKTSDSNVNDVAPMNEQSQVQAQQQQSESQSSPVVSPPATPTHEQRSLSPSTSCTDDSLSETSSVTMSPQPSSPLLPREVEDTSTMTSSAGAPTSNTGTPLPATSVPVPVPMPAPVLMPVTLQPLNLQLPMSQFSATSISARLASIASSKAAAKKRMMPVAVKEVDPRPTDILFGRGKSVVEHPGNAWFRTLVDQTMTRYEACTRMEKAALAEMIVEMVKNAGGRFLKPEDDGDCWEEADDHTARKKVAHTFRNRRKFTGPGAGNGNGNGGGMGPTPGPVVVSSSSAGVNL